MLIAIVIRQGFLLTSFIYILVHLVYVSHSMPIIKHTYTRVRVKNKHESIIENTERQNRVLEDRLLLDKFCGNRWI